MTTYSLNSQFEELVKVTLKEKEETKENNKRDRQSAKIQDFFQSNKFKKAKKCMSTRIKPRNFLSNIASVGINREDFYNENYIFNVYLLITKNLIPFSLDRKLADKNKHQMLYLFWKECMPQKFYQHIC